MDSVMEAQQAPTMSLREAEDVLHLWQSNLQLAQSALAAYEQQVGQLALSGNASGAQQELTRLQSEIRVAEQACIAALAQSEVARRDKLVKQLVDLRAEKVELDQQVKEPAAILNELRPQVEKAQKRLEYLLQRQQSVEWSTVHLELRLQELQSNG